MSAGSTSAGVDGDVMDPALDAPVDARLPREPRGFLIVAGRELEVHGALGAALEQLELDLADAAAHLEHRRALETAALQERHDLPPGPVEPVLAVALGHAPREARR